MHVRRSTYIVHVRVDHATKYLPIPDILDRSIFHDIARSAGLHDMDRTLTPRPVGYNKTKFEKELKKSCVGSLAGVTK